MKSISTKIFTIIIAGMLVLAAGIPVGSVFALSGGVYLADATPHYRHPVTGLIEDSGGESSAVLGQAMSESVTYKQALVEVDPEGDSYVTVRLQLTNLLENPQFQADGEAVNVSLMQEDPDRGTADYRMKVDSEKSVIRCDVTITAMGRSVIFYITLSNLQPGSGDFITGVKSEDPKPSEPPTASETPKTSDTPGTSETPIPTTGPVPSDTPDTSKAPDTSDTPEPSDTPVTGTSESETNPPKTAKPTDPVPTEDSRNPAAGLQEFDENGNAVTGKEPTNPESESENGGNPSLWPIAGGVIAVILVIGCIGYFGFFKKKK